jgi:bis(5'-nucleosyl)-tetraphosphatase (symmetrical)
MEAVANYVIGDVQGCFKPLQALLRTIAFKPHTDTLWFAGDLVNRGPQSLDTLRYIVELGPAAHMVLGNHDLHLLALYCGVGRLHHDDTVQDILQAPDCSTLIHWLRHQALVLRLPPTENQCPALMVHAGILPQWNWEEALALSSEVEYALQQNNWQHFMAALWGNQPDLWHGQLHSIERLRLIVNVCTRMRMLHADGRLDLHHKGPPHEAQEHLQAWFEFPRQDNTQVYFGHWSGLPALKTPVGFCLDTGCVWGQTLTAMRLEDGHVFAVKAEAK